MKRTTSQPKTQSLKILFLTAECAPFYKVGGLGDVAGSLPQALNGLGHDVRVMMPRYRLVDDQKFSLRRLAGVLQVPIGDSAQTAFVEKSDVTGATTYFIGDDRFLNRPSIYGQADEAWAFTFFCKAAIYFLQATDWRPDVIHCHDWHTGATLMLLDLASNQVLNSIARVFSIHNLVYQGETNASILSFAGFDPNLPRIWGEYSDTINWMSRGIAHADMINTVSPTYAQEMMTPEYGANLDTLLRARSERVTGILNGINRVEWNPATDPALAAKFSVKSLNRRAANKRAVQELLQLKIDPVVPLIGVVSRLVEQKGVDLLLASAEKLLERNFQLAILGSGDPRYETVLNRLHNQMPDRIGIEGRFNDRLARLIYGGSDMFLMPSRYEPCGLGQMIAMRYGSIPIVRATGGLKDTVADTNHYPRRGTGFSFEWYAVDGLIDAVDRALTVFQDNKRWQKIQARAMDANFSWQSSAAQYVELYRKAMKVRSQVVVS